MRKHEPFGWVKYSDNVGYYCCSITGIRCDGVDEFIRLRGNWYSSDVLLEYYTFLDDSPFGVKVEDKEDSHE